MNDTSTAPILTATGLRKTYGRGEAAVPAVDGIDLALRPGEMVAVMGASGSGKTTLLHLLGGLVRADGGVIHFDGQDLTALSDAKLTSLRNRSMGVIFQAFNLLPTMTALDNVALPLLLAGRSRSAARAVARQKLEAVSMQHRAGHTPPRLSGGEQQRVAVARALVNDPKLILADEPTGNLDRRNTEDVCRLLRTVAADSNRAVLVVTHEQHVAAHADRVVMLADGKVEFEAPASRREFIPVLAGPAIR